MRKITVPLTLILFLLTLANPSNSQNLNYGYCLEGLSIAPEVLAKVEKLQAEQQARLAPLRDQMRATRDWNVKNSFRVKMDELVNAHRAEIWKLVPEAKTNSPYVARGYQTQRQSFGPGYRNARGNGLARGGAGFGRGGCRGVGFGAANGAGYGGGRGYGRGYARQARLIN